MNGFESVGYYRIVKSTDNCLILDPDNLEDPKAEIVQCSFGSTFICPGSFVPHKLCVVEFENGQIGNYVIDIEAETDRARKAANTPKGHHKILTKDDEVWNSIQNSIATQRPNG